MESLNPIFLNFIYAVIGGVLMLIFVAIAYFLFRNTLGYKIRDELKEGNVAVGLAVMGLFIAFGIGMALVIGLALS